MPEDLGSDIARAYGIHDFNGAELVNVHDHLAFVVSSL